MDPKLAASMERLGYPTDEAALRALYVGPPKDAHREALAAIAALDPACPVEAASDIARRALTLPAVR